MIDGKNFFDQLVKNDIRTYDDIWKISTGQGDDYTSGCLLHYNHFKEHYNMIAKFSSLKWERILYTNQYSIKNAIKQEVGQLFTTNQSWFMKVFLKSTGPFFEQSKYTSIRRFWTIFCHKTRDFSLQKLPKYTVLNTMATQHIFISISRTLSLFSKTLKNKYCPNFQTCPK